MNAKLIVEGKEFDIQIMDPELQKLLMPPKKTGYERVHQYDGYWYDTMDGNIGKESDDVADIDDTAYVYANYYSDATIAKNNARADTLMRQLRRFAVEHRKNESDWNSENVQKWYIYYDYSTNEVTISCNYFKKTAGAIYFDTIRAANLAIDTFRDELIWLFTEYKDSL